MDSQSNSDIELETLENSDYVEWINGLEVIKNFEHRLNPGEAIDFIDDFTPNYSHLDRLNPSERHATRWSASNLSYPSLPEATIGGGHRYQSGHRRVSHPMALVLDYIPKPRNDQLHQASYASHAKAGSIKCPQPATDQAVCLDLPDLQDIGCLMKPLWCWSALNDLFDSIDSTPIEGLELDDLDCDLDQSLEQEMNGINPPNLENQSSSSIPNVGGLHSSNAENESLSMPNKSEQLTQLILSQSSSTTSLYSMITDGDDALKPRNSQSRWSDPHRFLEELPSTFPAFQFRASQGEPLEDPADYLADTPMPVKRRKASQLARKVLMAWLIDHLGKI